MDTRSPPLSLSAMATKEGCDLLASSCEWWPHWEQLFTLGVGGSAWVWHKRDGLWFYSTRTCILHEQEMSNQIKEIYQVIASKVGGWVRVQRKFYHLRFLPPSYPATCVSDNYRILSLAYSIMETIHYLLGLWECQASSRGSIFNNCSRRLS